MLVGIRQCTLDSLLVRAIYILHMFAHKLFSYLQLRLCRMIIFHSFSICSVENSELLSGLLREWNIPHNVLNARPKVCESIKCW